jgi:hypothetical protein
LQDRAVKPGGTFQADIRSEAAKVGVRDILATMKSRAAEYYRLTGRPLDVTEARGVLFG